MAEQERKRPRWHDDEWVVQHPDIHKIPCRDCGLRANDVHNRDGDVIIFGATKAICGAYGYKPSEILWDGQPCAFYRPEESQT